MHPDRGVVILKIVLEEWALRDSHHCIQTVSKGHRAVYKLKNASHKIQRYRVRNRQPARKGSPCFALSYRFSLKTTRLPTRSTAKTIEPHSHQLVLSSFNARSVKDAGAWVGAPLRMYGFSTSPPLQMGTPS